MLINLRNALMTGKKWKNPYVTDGLVAMWDAEWNAGGGKHDATQRMIDLSGNGAMATVLAGSPEMNANYIQLDGHSAFQFTASPQIAALTKNAATIEIAVKFESTVENEFALYLEPTYSIIYSCFGYRIAGRYGLFASFWGSTYPQLEIMKPWPTYAHLYACTSTASRSVHYINNAQKKSASQSDHRPFAVSCSSGYIGFGYGNYMKGKFYSARLYSRTLAAAELAANYAIDKARFGLS